MLTRRKGPGAQFSGDYSADGPQKSRAAERQGGGGWGTPLKKRFYHPAKNRPEILGKIHLRRKQRGNQKCASTLGGASAQVNENILTTWQHFLPCPSRQKAPGMPYSAFGPQINLQKITGGYPILVQPPVRIWSRRKNKTMKNISITTADSRIENQNTNRKYPQPTRPRVQRGSRLRAPRLAPSTDAPLARRLVVPANAPRRRQRRRMAPSPPARPEQAHTRPAPQDRGHREMTRRDTRRSNNRCSASIGPAASTRKKQSCKLL